MTHIHWLGAGLSSIPGIRRIVSSNKKITVWNRTLSKAEFSINHANSKNAIAKKFDYNFLEGDRFHSKANKQKMKKGIPLTDEDRIPMMYNFTGTIIVMTQVLLPFMILPIYSVMKGIPPSYMKAAQNLGATPTRAFIRVYMPQSVPGIGAGCILVFIVAIGYYITPELVGGKDGLMIGNFVAREMQQTLNWGLAAAMGAILLTAVLTLYWAYDRLIGLDNLKMG